MKFRKKKEKKINLLSLIIPSYKQEKTIARDIKKIVTTVSSLKIPFEIIVIVDGFVDKTFQNAKKIRRPNVYVYGYQDNQGKGYAVRFGFSKAKGDIIGFIDSGMDIDPTGVFMLLNHMEWYNADIIVGSKMHPVSQVSYPIARRILSWGYRTLTHYMFGFKVRDTQVGLKLFRSKVAKDVFPRLLVKKFAFDVEILAVSHVLGYKRIFEAPIKLNFKNASSITSIGVWKVILNTVLDTAAIFYRIRIIKYYRRSNKKNWLINK